MSCSRDEIINETSHKLLPCSLDHANVYGLGHSQCTLPEPDSGHGALIHNSDCEKHFLSLTISKNNFCLL